MTGMHHGKGARGPCARGPVCAASVWEVHQLPVTAGPLSLPHAALRHAHRVMGPGAGRCESRMTKSHGRKSRARNRSRRSGVAYAAANAGTLHLLASGPSATDLQPDPGRWGVETAPGPRTAAALIGASIERSAPCRHSLTAKLLEEDPIVLAVTAGAACRLHAAARVPEEEGPVARPAQAFSFLVEHARAHGGDARLLLAGVERAPAVDCAALLGDALDLFSAPAPVYGGGGAAAIAVSSDARRDPYRTAATSPAARASSAQQGEPDPYEREHRRRHPARGKCSLVPRRVRHRPPVPGEEDRTSCGGILHRQSSRPRRRRDDDSPHPAQDLRGGPPGSGPSDDRLPG